MEFIPRPKELFLPVFFLFVLAAGAGAWWYFSQGEEKVSYLTETVRRGDVTQTVTLYVVAPTLTREQVLCHCRERLPAGAMPDRIELVEAIPVSEMGKKRSVGSMVNSK